MSSLTKIIKVISVILRITSNESALVSLPPIFYIEFRTRNSITSVVLSKNKYNLNIIMRKH